GFPDDIPDEQENDLGSRDIPSWRRISSSTLRHYLQTDTMFLSINKEDICPCFIPEICRMMHDPVY
ncbi:hypothetical protein O5163_25770, partial [Escherichia coli]|nr:hypothetical protein [Escherichia coli]